MEILPYKQLAALSQVKIVLENLSELKYITIYIDFSGEIRQLVCTSTSFPGSSNFGSSSSYTDIISLRYRIYCTIVGC